MKKLLGIVVLGLLLSGNAYAFIKGAGWETLNIVSTPKNAECQLTNNKGSWFVFTPQKIKIKRSKKKLKIICNKSGYNTSTTYYSLRDLKKAKLEEFAYDSGLIVGSAIAGDPIGAAISGVGVALTKVQHKFGTYATHIIGDIRSIAIDLQKVN